MQIGLNTFITEININWELVLVHMPERFIFYSFDQYICNSGRLTL